MPTRKLVTRYEDDLALFPDRWHKVALTAGTLFLITYPVFADNQWLTIANLTLVTIVGAIALMILTGFTGQISLGHAAFLAVGAYTAAMSSSRFGLPFWLALPLAGVLSAAVGLAVGPFALRLKGLYLAIITMGLVFIVNHLLLSFPAVTGGVSGIAVPMHVWFVADAGDSFLTGFSQTSQLGPFRLTFERKLYVVFLVLAAITAWCGVNLKRSNTGRAMAAVRDHDLAASVMGVPLARYKVIAFGVSSFFGGVAGAMFAFQQQFITIDPPFNLTMSIQYIAIIVIGGIGTVFGAVAGAIVFTVVEPASELLTADLPLLRELSSAQRSILFLSFLVCGFMIAEPRGLLGVWQRIKRYFTMWPFTR
jgi:branched-chain amino acid transport system permease protein